MKRISLKGVAIGAVTDIVTTNILMLPLIIYVMASLNSAGVPSDKISGTVMEVIRASLFYFFLSWLLGGLGSMLGGYVSARIAKHNEILNGALSSFLCLSLGVYALISGSVDSRFWLCVVSLPVSLALATFGGYLRSVRKARG